MELFFSNSNEDKFLQGIFQDAYSRNISESLLSKSKFIKISFDGIELVQILKNNEFLLCNKLFDYINYSG